MWVKQSATCEKIGNLDIQENLQWTDQRHKKSALNKQTKTILSIKYIYMECIYAVWSALFTIKSHIQYNLRGHQM